LDEDCIKIRAWDYKNYEDDPIVAETLHDLKESLSKDKMIDDMIEKTFSVGTMKIKQILVNERNIFIYFEKI